VTRDECLTHIHERILAGDSFTTISVDLGMSKGWTAKWVAAAEAACDPRFQGLTRLGHSKPKPDPIPVDVFAAAVAAGKSIRAIAREERCDRERLARMYARMSASGDPRFPEVIPTKCGANERPAVVTTRSNMLDPDRVAALLAKGLDEAAIAEVVGKSASAVHSYIIRRRVGGDERFAKRRVAPSRAVIGRLPKPPSKPVSEFKRVVGDVTITVCPPGYATGGVSFLGGWPEVPGAAPSEVRERTMDVPQHLHRPKSDPKLPKYNGRGLAHPASKVADTVLR
jgi:hypothetical protein